MEVRHQLGKHLDAHRKRVAEAAARGESGGGTSSGGGAASGGGTTGTDAIRRALVKGFFANAARHDGGGHYTSVLRGVALKLHANSVLFAAPPDWLVFHETTYTTLELILTATKVNESWLSELAPHFYQHEERSARPAAALVTMGAAAAGEDATLTGGKRPRAPDDPEEEVPLTSRGASGSVAAMLGDSLVNGGRFF